MMQVILNGYWKHRNGTYKYVVLFWSAFIVSGLIQKATPSFEVRWKPASYSGGRGKRLATDEDFSTTMLKFTMPWEGWGEATETPGDPGGLTKYGISQRYNPEVDVPNLTLAQALEIYRKKYWVAPGIHRLPMPLAVAAMDCCVNFGPAGCKAMLENCEGSWETLNRLRLAEYVARARKPSKKRFLEGWVNRVNALNQFCAKIEQEKGV